LITGTQDIGRPIFHERQPFGQKITPAIGRFGFVFKLMRQGLLNDFSPMTGGFTCPITEGGAKTVDGGIGAPKTTIGFRVF